MVFNQGNVQDGIAEVIWWILVNYIEILATLTGLIYLVYSVKGKKLLWVFGLITSLLYVYVFFRSKIYADMGINVYYVIISIYGWIHWSRPSDHSRELPVSKLNPAKGLVLVLISILLFAVIAFILMNFTDSDIALWDAFTTSLSIVATWMLARKILEHWIVWIIVDSVSAGLYVYKGLYPTVLLFVVYTTLAVFGYYEWRKLWKIQETT
ncbi:MAG: nicotinamide riboside transporter PnuC [Bacteroidales bacterium]|jgi:nicotinamide mononucleotide transporter